MPTKRPKLVRRERPEPGAALWKSAICEVGNEANPTVAQRLDLALLELEAAGYAVQFVLPNGVNRFTIVGRLRGAR